MIIIQTPPDLLHPLTDIRCVIAKGRLPEHDGVFAAVLFQDKIYVALISPSDSDSDDTCSSFDGEDTPKRSVLYCSSGQLLSWNRLTTFDVVDFGLGAYQSKLVRVGGVEGLDDVGSRWSVLSSVLVSDDGKTWQDSLPPLPTRRAYPMVVTVGRNPEYLVVAGGCDYSPDLKCLPTVEVLAEEQWYTLQSFPVPCVVRNHCFHNGKLFTTRDSVFFCEVETLLAQCTECVAGKEPRSSLWKTIDEECDVEFSTKFIDKDFVNTIFFASHGGYLVTMIQKWSGQLICAHSPYTKSWIPVGKICTNLGVHGDILVSRASELVLFSTDCSDEVLKITSCGKVQLELHCKDFLGKAVTVMFLLSNF